MAFGFYESRNYPESKKAVEVIRFPSFIYLMSKLKLRGSSNLPVSPIAGDKAGTRTQGSGLDPSQGVSASGEPKESHSPARHALSSGPAPAGHVKIK